MKRALLAFLALAAPFLLAAPPAWWSDDAHGTKILNGNPPNNYGPVNQGQLKNVAKKAAQHLVNELAGGAGPDVQTMIDGFHSHWVRYPEACFGFDVSYC